MERKLKQLITAISGIGLCIGGNIISTWYITLGKDELVHLPFEIVGRIIIIAGIICFIGALLCQTSRYEKK